jgi:23S rRNA-/tRNA-specific pseudouridylate synthase
MVYPEIVEMKARDHQTRCHHGKISQPLVGDNIHHPTDVRRHSRSYHERRFCDLPLDKEKFNGGAVY